MAPRRSLVNLLTNYACTVRQQGRLIYCVCSGLVVTLLMWVNAIVSGLAAISLVILVKNGGNPTMGFVGGLMGVCLAAAFGHLAVQRYQRHGHFELDGDRAVLRRYCAGRMVGEFSFDEILRISLVLDATDGIRLSGPPSWLQVGLENGDVFRLAKGSHQELAPVCAALRDLGLRPAAV